jgi:hypothetical protein
MGDVMPQPVVTERHPAGYRWMERFPGAAVVLRAEGGGVYAAEDGRALWLIRDESGLASLLANDDPGDLVILSRYSDRERWVADVVRLRAEHGRSPTDADVKTCPGRHDAELIRLVDDTAAAMEHLAAERGLRSVNERDHLQKCCAAAARRLATTWEGTPTVATQLVVAFDAWQRLGSIDIALTWPDATPVLIELKCGRGRDATGECVWDAIKLAFAAQNDRSVGFLLAGARATDWNKPVRGAEFFGDGPHDTALLRVLYGDWWRQWERNNDPWPTELPRSFSTEHVHTAAFHVAGTRWELRLAQVFANNGERLSWPRFTRA